MAKLRLYPHRIAAPSTVSFGDWWIDRSGARARLADLLSGWDYASEERVGTSLTLDVDALLASTGHSTLEDLEVLLLADCPSAQRRIVARHPLAGYIAIRDSAFSLTLPAGELAGAIRLSAHLVVARDIEGTPPRVANVRGARLSSSKTRTVVLEGDASRFPTEPAPFSELGLPNAPWTLHTTFADLETSFMGGIRLLVNTEDPVGRMLLDSSTADRVSGLAMGDVIRLLVAILSDARYAEAVAEGGFDEGTVGFVVDSMCAFFLGYGLLPAIKLYGDDPLQFDRLLHERVRPLERVFE
jgi:hypothetical protein